MFENLADVERKYEETEILLYQPEVACDAERFTALMKQQKAAEPIVSKYREYKTLLSAIEEAKELLSEGDAELKELALLQLNESREMLETVTKELTILLIPKDPNDERNVIVEIRGGTGGEESALFAGTLFRMYSMYAEKRGWKISVISANETELGGYKEIVFSVEGEGAYSRLKFESGVHRVQRVPETETQGRIHTSAATVAVLPEVDDVEIDINPNDLQIDTFRSSGAGGQHINKTSSAIRITHLPTGMVVECQDERSQYKNKDKAMKVLKSRLLQQEQQKQNDAIAGERKSMVGSGDRSEKIRTYNFPQYRISDHRIGLTLYKLEQFISGELDEVIDALITADTAKKLANENNEDNI